MIEPLSDSMASALEQASRNFGKDPRSCSSYTALVNLQRQINPKVLDPSGLKGLVLAQTHNIAVGENRPSLHDGGCPMYRPVSGS